MKKRTLISEKEAEFEEAVVAILDGRWSEYVDDPDLARALPATAIESNPILKEAGIDRVMLPGCPYGRQAFYLSSPRQRA
jgi:hypothetical protein